MRNTLHYHYFLTKLTLKQTQQVKTCWYNMRSCPEKTIEICIIMGIDIFDSTNQPCQNRLLFGGIEISSDTTIIKCYTVLNIIYINYICNILYFNL
jgi:hypothetical protein